MAEDEEEDDETLVAMQMECGNPLTNTPPAAHSLSAPSASKPGRSPAHRLAKHQRNARRILDSWMADDDLNQETGKP